MARRWTLEEIHAALSKTEHRWFHTDHDHPDSRAPIDVTALVGRYEAQYKASEAIHGFITEELESLPVPDVKTTEEAVKLDADEHRVSCGACRYEWTASREGALSILGLTTICKCGSHNICIHGKHVSL